MNEDADSEDNGRSAPRPDLPAFDHGTFLSPFTWRYGSASMRQIWSELHKRRLMRRVWVALAAGQYQAGLVTAEQLADLRQHREDVDVARAREIEREIRHDVMAEIRAFAEQCPVGGAVIHWGATSTDITDNVDVLRVREAAELLMQRLQTLLGIFAVQIEATAHMPVMAYTHIQPAEPTTLGYRFAVYAQDLLAAWHDLRRLVAQLKGKGLKGAVGSQAAFAELLAETAMTAQELEAAVMAELDLPYFPVATQTYPRQQDLRVAQFLARLAAVLHKFALDFRILQSPSFGEWSEPFGRQQVGSSAMPFKRNPINMENVCSLARYVAAMPAVAWDNASQTILERSLDDSANRRLFLAEGFLAVDEMLLRVTRVLQGMELDQEAIHRNLARYAPFAASERVLMALVSAGADRQQAHEWLREASMQAWRVVKEGAEENPLAQLLQEDRRIQPYLTRAQIERLMDAEGYVGSAPERSLALVEAIRTELGAS